MRNAADDFMRESDYAQVLKIWQACFGDEERYVRFFWDNCFPMSRGLVRREAGQAVSMLFLIPGALRKLLSGALRQDDDLLPAEYVYAVATLPEYRGRGCAADLMLLAERIARQEGKAALCLMPGEPGLYDYYAKLGYAKAFVQQDFDLPKMPENLAEQEINPNDLYAARAQTWHAQGYFAWPAHMLAYMHREHVFTGGKVYADKAGYVFLNADGSVKERCVNRPAGRPGGMMRPLDSRAQRWLDQTGGQAYLGFPLN